MKHTKKLQNRASVSHGISSSIPTYVLLEFLRRKDGVTENIWTNNGQIFSKLDENCKPINLEAQQTASRRKLYQFTP